MCALPFSPAIWALTLFWSLAQLTLNSSYGAVTAMLPDQVRAAPHIAYRLTHTTWRRD
jgi:hypothetical protein